jgi:hypothetical protein
METNNFKFFIDDITIEKGKSKDGKDIMKVGGIASTKDKDSDDEMIDPKGYDTKYFLENGFLNYNHQAKFNPKAVIGEPTTARVTKDGLYIEGFLYADSELAQSVYETTKMLEKSSSKRRMGFSIEGQALERDASDERKITKAKLTGCALTLNPKNPNTLVNILKGEHHENDFEYDYEDLPQEAKEVIKKSEDYLVHIEKDGRVLQVDKDLRVKITQDGKVEKALTTAAPTQVESVDQDTKDKMKLPGEQKNLTKGEVYSQIFNYIYEGDFEKAELVYQLAEAFSKKRNTMKGLDRDLSGISNEDIQKSIDAILDQTSDLEKGGYIKKKSEDPAQQEAMMSAEEYETMKSDCSKMMKALRKYEKGLKKGIRKGEEEVEEEPQDGVEGDQVEKGPDEIEENPKMGVEGEEINKSLETPLLIRKSIKKLEKSLSNDINSAIGGTNRLVKSLVEATENMLERNIQLEKSLDSEVERNSKLEKSLESITEKVDSIMNTPIPSRTVTSDNYKQHPRLEKSMDTGTSLHLVQNKKQILDILDKSAGLDTASPDMRMASAMATFEATGNLDKSIIGELQKAHNITILG